MDSTSKPNPPNQLIHATSPYLLQHAYNPVDWHEWGNLALQKAKVEDKPILVSIGYSSCHWCHVMERECFENEDLAALMNDYFICIKVDREERPDIDQIYMDAVQAMGINGGWPLNVFLTPDQKPFYGGTYFPPKAWAQILQNIHQAWRNRKEEIIASSEDLTRHISKSDITKFITTNPKPNSEKILSTIYQNFESRFDTAWGGMEKAPKFIMPSLWLWLLRYHQVTKHEQALSHINLTLTKIIQGGIYDQVGGGFARYSVDNEWFAPHFEKMLYDNAQLLSLYSEAFKLTRNEAYKRVAYETFNWLQREMRHPEGGFYSAIDADSEGVEGKFYCFTKSELTGLLGVDAALLCEFYGVTESGNWEHGMNILHQRVEEENFLSRNNLDKENWHHLLYKAKVTLLQARESRIRPGLDDKILTGWNAMMIAGLIDAYHAFTEERFLHSAQTNIDFLERNLMDGSVCYRSFKGKRAPTEGFLEDYAFLIQAYIKLYQADFNEQWLQKASAIVEYVIKNFYDETDGLFFYSSLKAEKLITRKKEIFDNVIPSSNSVMTINLLQLCTFLDTTEWKQLAERMVNNVAELIQKEPNYMSHWGIALMESISGYAEVVLVGPDAIIHKNELQKHFLPFALFMGAVGHSNLPLVKDKKAIGNQTTFYVCRDKSCKQPVFTLPEALKLI
ncbi:MAG: thioredoxin domain-containing protein [Cyclobacteriaceae bacterium]|nr:thioredoxin domain-containing protein [Cyclobacteriaceae bacterium]UYN85696.1 MAG: thioredoxin domain-containing protein [Cyclobacteriaceae bacterium]